MTRRVITGGPNTGKTTLSLDEGGGPGILHLDDFKGRTWEEQGALASDAIDTMPHGATVEGAQATRGLRQWLKDNPTGKPCDEVVHCRTVRGEQTGPQAAMAKGVETVLNEIKHELIRRGVKVSYR